MKQKLTIRSIENLPPAKGRFYTVEDADQKGLILQVNTSGAMSWLIYYRVDGQRRRPRIGSYPELSIDDARAMAREIVSNADKGIDYSQQKKDARKADTFAQFAQLYLEDAKPHLTPAVWARAQQQIKNTLLPAWGGRRLKNIKPDDVARMHRQLARKRKRTIAAAVTPKQFEKYQRECGGPSAANRCLATVKVMFNLAERDRLIDKGSNPAIGIKMLHEEPVEKYLTPDELGRLAEALRNAQESSPYAVAAIRLLMLTGARKREILDLKWEHVDAAGRCLRLPKRKTSKKTGNKPIYLNEPALRVLTDLANIRVQGNPFVICGHVTGAQLVNLSRIWNRICKAAKLEGVRIHDLRHVYGGVGAGLGMGLPILGKLLGHVTPAMTQRYANLAPDPVHAAAEAIGAALAESMQRGAAEVVEVTPHETVRRREKKVG